MVPQLIGGAALLLLLLGKKKTPSADSGVGSSVDGTPPTTHVVQSGDMLADLAERFYGSGFNNWWGAQIIATANPQYYSAGGQANNCCCPGWVLNIPEATPEAINAAHAEQSRNPTTWPGGSGNFPPGGCLC